MRKWISNLGTMFNVRPGEGQPTVLMLIHSFFSGVAVVYLGTASYTLFLTKFEAKLLPYVYIISAGVVTLVGLIYTKVGERSSFTRLLTLTLSALFGGICILYLLMLLVDSRWIVAATLIFYNIVLVLVGVEFWGLAGHLFNVRQGKRLFGLIGSGSVIAAIIGGVSVSLIVAQLGAVNLLLISAGGMFCSLLMLMHISHQYPIQAAEEETAAEKKAKSASELFRQRYILLIFTLAAFSIFGYYLIDYIFYNQIELKFDNEAKLASFIGIFYAGFRIVTLINNAFVYSSLISRFGLGIGLLTVPFLIMIGSLSAVALFHLPQQTIYFFWGVVAIKFLDNVFRLSIEEPSFRLLYQPVQEGQRLKAQTMLETVIEPTASAAAGIVLLILTALLSFDVIHLFYTTLFILIFWLSAAFRLKREYIVVLTNALVERKLKGVALSLNDGLSREVLEKGLKSLNPGEVIYCLNMLEEIEHEALNESMIRLINHPHPDVRQQVMTRIGALGITHAIEAVENHLKSETVPQVIGAALRTLAALAETDAFDKIFPYLEHEDLEIRKGAMVGLLRSGGIDGVLSAGNKLNTELNSSEPVSREFAAQVLGEVGISGFYRPLLNLLQDPAVEVQRAAIVASGKLKNMKLLPVLLQKFALPKVSSVALAAVVSFGEQVLKELETALDREDQPRIVRLRILRVMEKIGGDKVIEALKKRIDFSVEDIRTHILKALVLCKYQFPRGEETIVHERIMNEVADAAWTLSVMIDIGETEVTDKVFRALASEIDHNRRRIFLLLSMIYPRQSMLNAEKNLQSDSAERRAHALEVMDNLISQDIKTVVLPLFDDIPDSLRHARLVDQFPQKRINRHERIKEILTRSQQWISSWTQTCALLSVGKIATMEFYDSVVACLADTDPVVRETAIWALGCINPDDLVDRLQPLIHDKSPQVSAYARFIINTVGFCSISPGTGYLTRSGKYSVDLFMNILEDEGERRIRRCRAAGILSRFGNEAARNALLKGLSIADKTVRSSVLDALVKGDYLIQPNEKEQLITLLRIEIEDAKKILYSIIALAPEPQAARLVQSLNEEIIRNRKRVLSILVLLTGDENSLNTVFYWYIYQQQAQVPQAIDTRLKNWLTAIADDNLRKKVYALFRVRDYARLNHLPTIKQGQREADIRECLGNIAFSRSTFTLSWSRICALELIVALNIPDFLPRIIESLSSPHDVIRATAAWAIYKLNHELFDQYAARLRNDPSLLVSKTAEQLQHEQRHRLAAEIPTPPLPAITPHTSALTAVS